MFDSGLVARHATGWSKIANSASIACLKHWKACGPLVVVLDHIYRGPLFPVNNKTESSGMPYINMIM
jgi:hypothetical protein